MTRHSSDFHHIYFPSAVKYDRFTNWLATDIVAISENVQNILLNWESVNPAKVHLIKHGIDLGTVTVVYTNPEVNKEYLKYCEFLHHRKLIEKDIEQLTLEDTQGVTGLKALRIKIKMDQSEILHTREIEEIISNL
jgi:hypothetical protein